MRQCSSRDIWREARSLDSTDINHRGDVQATASSTNKFLYQVTLHGYFRRRTGFDRLDIE